MKNGARLIYKDLIKGCNKVIDISSRTRSSRFIKQFCQIQTIIYSLLNLSRTLYPILSLHNMEVLRQGLQSLTTVQNLIQSQNQHTLSPQLGLLVDLKHLDRAIQEAINLTASPHQSVCTSANQNLSDQEFLETKELHVKQYKAKIIEYETLNAYLSKVSEQKNSIIKELTYKYHQISSEQRMLRTEYEKLKEFNHELEKESNNSKSQLLSMRASLSYYDPVRIVDESKLEQQVETLKTIIRKERCGKQECIDKLNSELHFKNIYTDQLLCQVQNLHQSLSYSKDQIYGLKGHLDSILLELAEERSSRSSTERNLVYAQTQLDSFKTAIFALHSKLDGFWDEAARENSELLSSLQSRHSAQILTLQTTHISDLQVQKQKHDAQIKSMESKFKQSIRKFQDYSQDKVDKQKSFYESRIKNMINQYSTSEGQYQSQVAEMSRKYQQAQDKQRELRNALQSNSRLLAERTEDLLSKEKTISNLSLTMNSADILLKQKNAECKSQHANFNKHLGIFKNDIMEQLEHTCRIKVTRQQDRVQILQKKNKETIQRIQAEFDFTFETSKNKWENEKQVLIGKIAQQEKDRLQEIFQINEKYVQVQAQAKEKQCDYAKRFASQKEETLVQWRAERSKLVEQHKEAIRFLEKRHRDELDELTAVSQRNLQQSQQQLSQDFETQRDEITRKLKSDYNETLDSVRRDLWRSEVKICDLNESILQKDRRYAQEIEAIQQHQQLQDQLSDKKISKQESTKNWKDKNFNVQSSHTFIQIGRQDQILIANKNQERPALKLTQVKDERAIEASILALDYENKLKSQKQEFDRIFSRLQQKYQNLKRTFGDSMQNNRELVKSRQELAMKQKQIFSMNKNISQLRSHIKHFEETSRIFPHERSALLTKRQNILDRTAPMPKRGISAKMKRRQCIIL